MTDRTLAIILAACASFVLVVMGGAMVAENHRTQQIMTNYTQAVRALGDACARLNGDALVDYAPRVGEAPPKLYGQSMKFRCVQSMDHHMVKRLATYELKFNDKTMEFTYELR
ncbi:MAG: hypothetical protein AB7U75_14910 [Hyphomicrobiaceae bacterium]